MTYRSLPLALRARALSNPSFFLFSVCIYVYIMSRKLNRNDSRAQRDRFYRDSDIKEKIEEQEAKVRLRYLNTRLLSRLRTNGPTLGLCFMSCRSIYGQRPFSWHTALRASYMVISALPPSTFSHRSSLVNGLTNWLTGLTVPSACWKHT